MSQELKNEVASLKKQVAELSRAKDYLEIWKLQSRYSHLYFMLRNSEIPSLFAQKTPGVSIDIEDAGIYEGIEGVKRFWTTVLSEERYHQPGWLAVHRREGKLDCMLCLGKYDMEYVKEDGEWKFFKLAYRIAYMCPLDKGWVEEPITGSIAGLPENTPDKPATNYLPYSRYRINIFPPPPPEPYED